VTESMRISVLDNSFKTINDWLKYAEQKNASLIIFNAGLIWGVTRLFMTKVNINQVNECLNWIGYTSASLAIVIAIISMMPVLSRNWYFSKAKNHQDNVFYFGDIAKYNTVDYLKLIGEKHDIQDKYNPIEFDLASQVVINSEIALAKFQRFKLVSNLTIISIMAFLTSIIIFLVDK
jgi:hypothetical protein